MAGNLVSIMNASLGRSESRQPECGMVHFHCTHINNKDFRCPSCHIHFHRKLGSSRKCPWCNEDLGITRGKKPKQ